MQNIHVPYDFGPISRGQTEEKKNACELDKNVKSRANQSRRTTSRDTTLRSCSTRLQASNRRNGRSACLPARRIGRRTHARPVTPVSPRQQPCVHGRTGERTRDNNSIAPPSRARTTRAVARTQSTARPAFPQPFSRHPGRAHHVRPRATPGGVFLSFFVSLLVSSFQRASQAHGRALAPVGGLRSVPIE